MASSNLLLLISFFFFSISSLFVVSLSSKPSLHDLKWWCDHTPYSDTCHHFLTAGNNPQFTTTTLSSSSASLISRPAFRKTAIKLAMGRAETAQAHNYRLGPKCRSKKERAAWADCLTLYNDLVSHLNTTLTNTRCTDFDSQTWLSAALTDLETCRTGFSELGLSGSPVLPNNYNNVSKLLSNALSLSSYNATSFVATSSVDSDGFPSWVSAGNRRLLQAGGSIPPANIVVAQDGSGEFRTVKEAIVAAGKRQKSGSRFVIRIKSGVYKENVEIGKKLKNIMLVGDGMKSTIITGSRSVVGGSTTFNSATVVVTGDGFIARDITFRNTAGAKNHQAVALRSGADLSVFYKCGFEGYQDTLYVHSNRQFYRECDIYGTVDFIFGNAAAVLQNCNIFARRPMDKQKITVTAQGRTDPNQNTGISIHNSRVVAGSDLKPVLGTFKTFLGRPWQAYSRTVFMQTFLDSLVDPAGWLEWNGNFALKTLYYGEYRNTGPGAPTGGRVKWAGYRVISSATEAGRFSVGNFIAGGSWISRTGIPFTSGL